MSINNYKIYETITYLTYHAHNTFASNVLCQHYVIIVNYHLIFVCAALDYEMSSANNNHELFRRPVFTQAPAPRPGLNSAAPKNTRKPEGSSEPEPATPRGRERGVRVAARCNPDRRLPFIESSGGRPRARVGFVRSPARSDVSERLPRRSRHRRRRRAGRHARLGAGSSSCAALSCVARSGAAARLAPRGSRLSLTAAAGASTIDERITQVS